MAGDLLSSGAPVLLVVSDVARRRAGLERTLAGMAPGGLAVVSWEALARGPELAQPFAHLVAMDPPPVPEGVDLLASAPGGRFAELAWGSAESEFTLAYWRHSLGVRAQTALLWRELSPGGGLDGPELDSALRGAGSHPRTAALAGRMLRVLAETGLVEVDLQARGVLVVSTERTSLERSEAFRAYAGRLAAVERHLAPAAARAA